MEWNITKWAKVAHLGKDTVADIFRDAGIEPRVDGKNHYYPVCEATVEAVALHKQGQTSADRRNNAQADNLEIDAQIKRREYRPVEEHNEFAVRLVSVINQFLDDDRIPPDLRDAKVSEIEELLDQYEHDLRSDSDTDGQAAS